MRLSNYVLLNSLFALLLVQANVAHAYLGGFEPDDGYAPFLNDVVKYNAGQYGVNAGGGSYTPIPDNTGLWKKLQGPIVPATGTTGNYAYATGHQYYDRTNPGFPNPEQGLVITTNTDGWTAGPQEYSYSLDSYDLGGVNPATTGGDVIDISFWSCSFLWGTSEGGGLGAGTLGNVISFYDSSGNLGFEVGGIQPGTSTDYAATNVGTWVQSAVSVGTNTFHRWDIELDLNLQTVSIDVFEASTLTNLVSNAPLINNMSDFTEMRFLSTPGIINAKIWALDDFGMSVRGIPEPGSLALATSLVVGIMAWSRTKFCQF